MQFGYAARLRTRKRIEEVFGWMKTVGGLRKTNRVRRPEDRRCFTALKG